MAYRSPPGLDVLAPGEQRDGVVQRVAGRAVPRAGTTVVGREDHRGVAVERGIARDRVEYLAQVTIDGLHGIQVLGAHPAVGVSGRVRVAEADHRVVERVGVHRGDEAAGQGGRAVVVGVNVDLVAAVVRAEGVEPAVGAVPAPVEEGELALAGEQTGAQAVIVDDIEHAGHVSARGRVDRAAVVGVEADAVPVGAVGHRPGGQHVRVIGERLGVAVVGPGVEGRGAFVDHPVDVRQLRGAEGGDGVGPQAVEDDVDHKVGVEHLAPFEHLQSQMTAAAACPPGVACLSRTTPSKKPHCRTDTHGQSPNAGWARNPCSTALPSRRTRCAHGAQMYGVRLKPSSQKRKK